MTPDRNNLLAAWSISRNPLLEGPAAFREGSSSPRELPLKAFFFPSHSSPQHALPAKREEGEGSYSLEKQSLVVEAGIVKQT